MAEQLCPSYLYVFHHISDLKFDVDNNLPISIFFISGKCYLAEQFSATPEAACPSIHLTGIQLHTHKCNMEHFCRIRKCCFCCGGLRGGAIAIGVFYLVQYKNFIKFVPSFCFCFTLSPQPLPIRFLHTFINITDILNYSFSPLQASCDK